jgi:hypothetical protein
MLAASWCWNRERREKCGARTSRDLARGSKCGEEGAEEVVGRDSMGETTSLLCFQYDVIRALLLEV